MPLLSNTNPLHMSVYLLMEEKLVYLVFSTLHFPVQMRFLCNCNLKYVICNLNL